MFARGSLGDCLPASRAPGRLFARGSLGDCLPVSRVCASVVGGPGSLVELGPCDVFGSVNGPARWAPLAAEAFEDMQLGPWVRRACRVFVRLGTHGHRTTCATCCATVLLRSSPTSRHAMHITSLIIPLLNLHVVKDKLMIRHSSLHQHLLIIHLTTPHCIAHRRHHVTHHPVTESARHHGQAHEQSRLASSSAYMVSLSTAWRPSRHGS